MFKTPKPDKRFLSLPFLIAFLLAPAAAGGQSQSHALLPPDERFKADVLVVVAHPDDDVLVGGYLARLSLDEHKRIAVVYCTNGDGGGNSVGNEAGAALGQIRVLEARHALAVLGIENVWFLPGHDTPGQNVLRSLDHWNHGLALDEVVRLVRLTRPDVVLTWLPDYVVGENHEDHQASGVLATEAFDAAGDPTVFPEQVSPPRDRNGMSNLTEGLSPWQPKKLYYFTDAFENFSPYWHDAAEQSPYRGNFLDGAGPSYETKEVSPSRHKSYAQINAEQQFAYLTQEGSLGNTALKAGNFKEFEYPVRLIFGKSVVGGSATGDVFEHVSSTPAPFVSMHGYVPASRSGLTFEIGDPWRFYSLFWKAHAIDHLASLIPMPEQAARFGDALTIPLLACNAQPDSADVSLRVDLPSGWTDQTPFTQFTIRAGECYPIQANVTAPSAGKAVWQQLKFTASVGPRNISVVTVRVYLGESGGLPQ